jgi:hypothetical protein
LKAGIKSHFVLDVEATGTALFFVRVTIMGALCALANADGNPVFASACFFGVMLGMVLDSELFLLVGGVSSPLAESVFLPAFGEAGFLVGETLILPDLGFVVDDASAALSSVLLLLARCFIPLKDGLLFPAGGEGVLDNRFSSFFFSIARASVLTSDSVADSFLMGFTGDNLSLVCCFHRLFSRAPQLLDFTLILVLEGGDEDIVSLFVLPKADDLATLLQGWLGESGAAGKSTSFSWAVTVRVCLSLRGLCIPGDLDRVTVLLNRLGDAGTINDVAFIFSGERRRDSMDLACVISLGDASGEVSSDVAGEFLSVSSFNTEGLASHVAGFFFPPGVLAAAAANILGSWASALLALTFFGDGVFGFHDRLDEKSSRRPLEYFSVMTAACLNCFLTNSEFLYIRNDALRWTTHW